MKTLSQQKGFALLFAVLLAALLLAVGLSIFNLSLKEVQISGAGRESQMAFYAADAGIECAIYWDAQIVNGQTMFSSSTVGFQPQNSVECGGVDVSRASFDETDATQGAWSNPNGNETTFSFQLTDASLGLDQPCVTVSVAKDTAIVDGSSVDRTTIRASGRNICDTEARRVERGLVAVY